MRTLVAACAAAFLSLLPAASAVAATDHPDAPGREITRWDETISLRPDGSALVSLEMDFDFGSDPGHGPYLTVPTEQTYDADHVRRYEVTDVSATSPTGAPANVNLEQRGSTLAIRIGDPDIDTVSGVQTYVITYRLHHVVTAVTAADAGSLGMAGDEFAWAAVGEGWTVPIANATVRVTADAPVQAVTCFARSLEADTPCDRARHGGRTAVFAQASLAPGEPFAFAALYPAGSFDTTPDLVARQHVGRAFSLTPWTVGSALAILVIGLAAIWRVRRATASDERYANLTPGMLPSGSFDRRTEVGAGVGEPALRSEPPPGLRPGQLGTLIDAKADARDVTATLVDLAVRGYLRIDEVQDASGGRPEYRLVKLQEPGSDLAPYERTLFYELFLTRSEVTMEQLRSTFAASMRRVQGELYDEVVRRGWFRRNPRSARTAWGMSGLGVAVVGGLLTLALAQTTSWALVPTPLVILGVVLIATVRDAPARTAAGTAVLDHARGYRAFLETVDPSGMGGDDASKTFSRHLPFAVAFGVARTWADAFTALSRSGVSLAEPAWYGGVASGAFWMGATDVGERVTGFANVATTSMSAPPPSSSSSSSFSAGGFSGGGAGGGGGGW